MRRQLAKEEEARASFAQAMKDGPVTDYHAWQYMRERRGYPPKDSDAAALAACITPKQKWLLQELSELPYPNPWRRAEVPALCWPYAGPFPAHGRAPNHAKGDDLDLLMRALQRGEQVYPFKFPTPVYKGTLTLVTPKCGPSLSAALEANPGVFTCPSMDDSVAVWQTRAETDAKLVTAEFWARETKEVRIPVTRHPMTQAQADKWSSEDTRALAASTGRPVWILVFEDGVIVFSEVYFADPSQFLELPVKVEHCFPAGHFFPDRPLPSSGRTRLYTRNHPRRTTTLSRSRNRSLSSNGGSRCGHGSVLPSKFRNVRRSGRGSRCGHGSVLLSRSRNLRRSGRGSRYGQRSVRGGRCGRGSALLRQFRNLRGEASHPDRAFCCCNTVQCACVVFACRCALRCPAMGDYTQRVWSAIVIMYRPPPRRVRGRSQLCARCVVCFWSAFDGCTARLQCHD